MMTVTIMKKTKDLKTRVGMFKNKGENIPAGNFLGGNLPGGSFPKGSLMGGNFSGRNFPGESCPDAVSNFYVQL